LVGVGLLVATGCQETVDHKDLQNSLLQADREFAQLSAQEGVAVAFDRFMAEGATLFRQGAPPYVGRQAIRTLFAGEDTGTLAWEPYYADVAASGDLGYTLGRYVYRSAGGEEAPQISHGHYVSIWRRQSDGTWKYVFDAGIRTPASPE
jgi:ketosteroid isomerase-like protein